LSMAATNQEQGKKGPIVWQKPKLDHQRHFMLPIMQTSIPLVIVCMRAKYPMKEVKKPNGGKEWVRSEDLEPKQSEDILYEMFVHGWIDEQHRFRGTKYTRPDLRQVIRDGEPISLDTGRRLAEWARGVAATSTQQQSPAADRFLPDATEAARKGTAALTAWVGENKANLPAGWIEANKAGLWLIAKEVDAVDEPATAPAAPPPAAAPPEDPEGDFYTSDDPLLTVAEQQAAKGSEALQQWILANGGAIEKGWLEKHKKALEVKAAAADRPKKQPAQTGFDV